MSHLAAAMRDEKYVRHQQELYDHTLGLIEEAKAQSDKMKDVELEKHIKELNNDHLRIADWKFTPLDIKPNDYVSDLINRYLLDLRNRSGLDIQSKPTFTQVMRRGVFLGDATDLIE